LIGCDNPAKVKTKSFLREYFGVFLLKIIAFFECEGNKSVRGEVVDSVLAKVSTDTPAIYPHLQENN
jgi:hypothetical protein